MLGCTHFPLLSPVLEAIVGPDVVLVDSAVTTAGVVAEMLTRAGVAAGNRPAPAPIRLLATDAPDRFARVAANFLPFPITAAMVELVDLQQAGVKAVRVQAPGIFRSGLTLTSTGDLPITPLPPGGVPSGPWFLCSQS